MQPARDRVVFVAAQRAEAAARWGIERMRFATGVDDDLRPFHDRFRDDPLIGRAVRADPCAARAAAGREPWEALAWAITEQLIAFHRAVAIQRNLIARLGRRCAATGLRDMPAPAAVAARRAGRDRRRRARADARARRCAGRRARSRALDVAAEPRCAACARSPASAPWTMEMLALYGLGRYDEVPAGDLGYLEIVGRLSTGHRARPRRGGRGARVLRALRRVEGAGRRVPARARRRAELPISRPARREPLARQELVRERRAPAPAAA